MRFLESHGYKITVSETKGVTRKPDEEYKNPAEIESIVKAFSDKYPTLTKRISIGKSLIKLYVCEFNEFLSGL